MKMFEVLGHPVRAAIMGCFAERRLTRKQLQRLMVGVPEPTVYRNLRILVEGGYVQEVERLPGRGGGEIVYEASGRGWVTPDEVRAWTLEERVEVFQSFTQTLAATYRTYAAGGGETIAVAGGHLLHLTEAEAEDLRARIRALISDYQQKTPSEGAQRWIVADAYIPDAPENP